MRDPDLEKTMTTMEQAFEDLAKYAARTSRTICFERDGIIRRRRENSIFADDYSAEDLVALVHDGEERRCHEKLVEEIDKVPLAGWRALIEALEASKAALSRESGA